MESAGLRKRRRMPQQSAIDTTSTALEPPRYTIDLSLPPSQRYKLVAKDFKTEMRSLTSLFDTVIHDLHPKIPISLLRWAARLLLRRVHSNEETDELRGISEVTGVDMYLLVSFNVLLDLFMGCTSGGARVKDTGAKLKMLHFRTLDWGMDGLRKIIVCLEFVEASGGPVIASSVTYAGFVGVLTGVKKDLSISLNFRPNHDASTLLINFRFYLHQAIVLLGFRPSIASLLRKFMLPARADYMGEPLPSDHERVERDLPKIATTAAYLIFSDGKRTVTMEKDHRTAVVRSADDFIVSLNHDVEAESRRHIKTDESEYNNKELVAMGIENIVGPSIDRKLCITELWQEAVSRKRSSRRSKNTGLPYVTPAEVSRWMDVYDITNEQTHFATIMDPTEGKILSIKRYLEPIEVEDEYEENGV